MTQSLDPWGEDAPDVFQRAARAHRHEGPSAAQLARMLSAVEGAVTPPVDAEIVPRAVRVWTSRKSMLLGGVGVALIAGVWWWTTTAPHVDKREIVVEASTPPAVPLRAPAVAPGDASDKLQNPAQSESSDAPMPKEARALPRAARLHRLELAVVDPVAELVLLDRARRIMPADPARAYGWTEQHRARFRAGQFAEERELLAIEALSALARTREANLRAKAFRGSFPGSVHAQRLSEILSHDVR